MKSLINEYFDEKKKTHQVLSLYYNEKLHYYIVIVP